MDIVPQWDQLPELTWTEKITYLMREFLKHPQIPCPVEHLFGGGKYIREMRIPRGTLFIGRPHRHGHPIQLISGELIWITPHGRFHKVAPDSTVSAPGDQMVCYTLTDVVGRTIHSDNGERDTDMLENQIFHPVQELLT